MGPEGHFGGGGGGGGAYVECTLDGVTPGQTHRVLVGSSTDQSSSLPLILLVLSLLGLPTAPRPGVSALVAVGRYSGSVVAAQPGRDGSGAGAAFNHTNGGGGGAGGVETVCAATGNVTADIITTVAGGAGVNGGTGAVRDGGAGGAGGTSFNEVGGGGGGGQPGSSGGAAGLGMDGGANGTAGTAGPTYPSRGGQGGKGANGRVVIFW